MNTIKPKKRRTLGELKRSWRLPINLTKEEYEEMEKNAKKAGLTLALYARRVSLEGKVLARLTEEERMLFLRLVGMSNELNGLLVLAREQGVENAIASFEAGRDAVDHLLNRLKL